MKKRENRNGTFEDVSLSKIFHENTKQFLELETSTGEKLFTLPSSRAQFKSYPRFEKTNLPKNFPQEPISMQEVIEKRRSVKRFTKTSLSLETISRILFYSAGITYKEKEGDYSERAYPSVGGAYPLELYPVVLRSTEIKPGIYHYNVKLHALESIAKGDFTSRIIRFTNNQEWIKNASAVILISAIFKRTEMIYGDRGYRYVLLDAGHLAQNIVLVASSMGLGCRTIAEFFDDELNRLLDLDGTNESIVCIVVIGGVDRGLADRFRALFHS